MEVSAARLRELWSGDMLPQPEQHVNRKNDTEKKECAQLAFLVRCTALLGLHDLI